MAIPQAQRDEDQALWDAEIRAYENGTHPDYDYVEPLLSAVALSYGDVNEETVSAYLAIHRI